MKHQNLRKSRIAGLLALALGAVALLALSGVATAKDRGGDDNGRGHHGRHHNHVREFHNAGTISSFDSASGKLTIALSGGGSVSGLVTKATEIKCEGVDDRLTQRRDHGSDDNSGRGGEPGDDNGGHGNEAGDDNGGHGAEPGDDNGGHGVEPGDDNGGAVEPGDDRGGHGNEPGDDNGGHGNEAGDDNGGNAPMPAPGAPTPASCGNSSLVAGAFVSEAELRVGTGSAVFREIELGQHS